VERQTEGARPQGPDTDTHDQLGNDGTREQLAFMASGGGAIVGNTGKRLPRERPQLRR